MTKKKTIDLKAVFLGLQSQMESRLTFTRRVVDHPVAKGLATELEWNEMLSTYLPRRYCASKGFVIDSRNGISDEIDIVIYDRQYSPFILHQNGVTFVPAECVYAVIEVKQTLSAPNIKYAQNKAASVRRLHRTSAPITHLHGETPGKKPPRILAGIVAVSGTLSKGTISRLRSAPPSRVLNLGCSLTGKASFRLDRFHPWKTNKKPHSIDITARQASLVAFFLNLAAELQKVGTAVAMELAAYQR